MLAGPLPDYPFAGGGYDRLSEHRRDQDFLDAAWGDPSSRVVVMRGQELAAGPDGSGLRLSSPQDAPPGQRMLLGSLSGVVHFLVLVDECRERWRVRGSAQPGVVVRPRPRGAGCPCGRPGRLAPTAPTVLRLRYPHGRGGRRCIPPLSGLLDPALPENRSRRDHAGGRR